MKAAVVPSLNSQWEIKEVPTPEPGANQVLIKIGEVRFRAVITNI